MRTGRNSQGNKHGEPKFDNGDMVVGSCELELYEGMWGEDCRKAYYED